MHVLWHALTHGFGLSSSGVSVWELTLRTLRVALEATLIAALVGVPLGCLLGLGEFRGRRTALAFTNAGLRFPPVALGLILWLLLWPDSIWGGGPLSGLHWIYTERAVVLAQTLLALPVIAALTAAAVQSVSSPLLTQADPLLRGSVFTDRGVYKLGEEVHFKAILARKQES